MENNLSILENKELTIKSNELVSIINDFRKLENGKAELQHKNFMAKIKNEIELLEKFNISGQLNFKPSTYLNEQNKIQPCYELNRDGMLQMLNSESAIVRYKTIEYINQLETKLNNNQILLAGQKIQELQDSISDFKKSIEEAKQQFKPSHKKKLDYNRFIKALSSSKEEAEDIKEFTFTTLNIEKWEDTCVEDYCKIIETIKMGAKLFAINKIEQLSLV